MHVSLDSALGRQRRLNSVGESVLQIVPSATVAYSLRSLTGGDPKVVRVRRDTGGGAGDNDEQDFTASEVSSGALVDFVGSGNDGFVDTWYDQSGNGSDAVQATASEQPKIVDSATGALVPGGLLFSGGQTIDTTATFSFASGSSVSLFGVNKATGSNSGYLVKVGTYIIWRLSGGTRRMSLGGVNANSGSISGNEELWVPIMNVDSSGGTGNFFVDGTLTSSADASIGSSTVTNKVLKIGNSNWNGTTNEIILYTSDQTANRPALEANIMTNYGIS